VRFFTAAQLVEQLVAATVSRTLGPMLEALGRLDLLTRARRMPALAGCGPHRTRPGPPLGRMPPRHQRDD
jgi:hypothetical protein